MPLTFCSAHRNLSAVWSPVVSLFDACPWTRAVVTHLAPLDVVKRASRFHDRCRFSRRLEMKAILRDALYLRKHTPAPSCGHFSVSAVLDVPRLTVKDKWTRDAPQVTGGGVGALLALKLLALTKLARCHRTTYTTVSWSLEMRRPCSVGLCSCLIHPECVPMDS